jgi:hypothetical protein
MTALGAMRASLAGLAAELGWNVKKFASAVRECMAMGMIEVSEKASWISFPKFLKYNEPEGPNSVSKAWGVALDLLPECPEKQTLINRCRAYLESRSDAFRHAMGDGIWYAFRDANGGPCDIQELEPEPEPELELKQEKSSASVFPTSRRRHVVKIPSGSKTAKVWEAYAGAHEHRYRTAPVRNAKVNSNLSRLVDRLGEVEAPQVAAFYLTHNKPVYVSARHATDLLLRDAEGLRTEWATGIKSTTGEARNAERKDNVREQYRRIMGDDDGVKHE